MGRGGDVGPAQLKKRFSGRGKTEIFSQRLALIFAAEQASPLQFRDDLVDEVVEAARHIGEHHVEPVAAVREQPFLHLIGDRRRRSDKRKSAETAGNLRKLADRKVVAPRQRNEALAPALAGVRFRDFRQRSVEIKAGRVAAERNRQRREATIGMDETVEQRPLAFRFVDRFADDDERAWQDFQMIGRAAEPSSPGSSRQRKSVAPRQASCRRRR